MTDLSSNPDALRVAAELAAIAGAVSSLLTPSIRNLTDNRAFAILLQRIEQVRRDLENLDEFGLSLLLDDVLAFGQRLARQTKVPNAEDLTVWGEGLALLGSSGEIGDRPRFRLRSGTRGNSDIESRLVPYFPASAVQVIDDIRSVAGENPLSASFAFSMSPTAPIENAFECQVQSDAKLQSLTRRLRSFFQQGLIIWLRREQPDKGVALMGEVLERLTGLTGTAGQGRLWWVGSAFCEALAQRGDGPSPSIRRLLGQLEYQLRQLSAQGFAVLAQEPSPGLLRSLLFYIASVPGSLVTRPALWEAFGLSAGVTVACDAAARKRIQNILLGACERLEMSGGKLPEEHVAAQAHAEVTACADALGLMGEGRLRRDLLTGTSGIGASGLADTTEVRRVIDELLAISVRLDESPAYGLASEKLEDPSQTKPLPERIESSLLQVQSALSRLDVPAREPDPAQAGTDSEAGENAQAGMSVGDQTVRFDELVDLAALARRTAELAPPPGTVTVDALESDIPEPPYQPDTGDHQPVSIIDGIQVDTALLENLSLVASEIGSSGSRMEQQVGGIRDGMVDLNLALREIREQVRHLELDTGEAGVARRGTDVSSLGIGAKRMGALRDRLDALSDGLTRLDNIKVDIEAHTEQTQSLLNRQARDNVELRQGLMRSRWIKLADQEQRIRQWIAHAATVARKDVDVTFEHGGLQIDQSRFNDLVPVLQLLCEQVVGHALRGSAERIAAGLGPVATLALAFRRIGNELRIGVQVDDEDLSLAPLGEVDQRSRAIGGRIEQYPGGNTVYLLVGVTVQLVRVILVRVGTESVAIPVSYLTGLLRIPPTDLHRLDQPEPVLQHEGSDYQFAVLTVLLDLGPRRLSPEKAFFPVVLLTCGEHRLALLVDAVDDQEAVAMPPGHPALDVLPAVAGAAVLADGRAAVVLDVPALVHSVNQRLTKVTPERL